MALRARLAPVIAPAVRHVPAYRAGIQGPRGFFCAAMVGGCRRAPRDAYSVMGLGAGATSAEVKARFRELAKQYHPDLNKGDRSASMKMAELTSAYDTLMDPRKRSQLDQSMTHGDPQERASTGQGTSPFGDGFNGDEWVSPSQMFSEFRDVFGRTGPYRPQGAPPMSARGEDVTAQLEVSFLEAMQGCEKIVTLMVRQSCDVCRGTGAKEGTSWSTCRVCRGTGVQKVERGILSMGVPCHRCQGSGEILDHPCRACRGEGIRPQARDVRVAVPAGVRNLIELRVPSAGHAGTRGGKSGHLFVTVKVLPHERFRHVDDDVHIDVPLTLKQALLGGLVEMPTLDGTHEKLVIKPSTQPGATKVLRARGPPRLGGDGRGSIVVHFLLQLPKVLLPRQVELIEEFDLLSASAAAGENAGAKRDAGAASRPRAEDDASSTKESEDPWSAQGRDLGAGWRQRVSRKPRARWG